MHIMCIHCLSPFPNVGCWREKSPVIVIEQVGVQFLVPFAEWLVSSLQDIQYTQLVRQKCQLFRAKGSSTLSLGTDLWVLFTECLASSLPRHTLAKLNLCNKSIRYLEQKGYLLWALGENWTSKLDLVPFKVAFVRTEKNLLSLFKQVLS